MDDSIGEHDAQIFNIIDIVVCYSHNHGHNHDRCQNSIAETELDWTVAEIEDNLLV